MVKTFMEVEARSKELVAGEAICCQATRESCSHSVDSRKGRLKKYLKTGEISYFEKGAQGKLHLYAKI